MPPGRRYAVATASSVAAHAILLVLIGLLAGRTPVRPAVLIPIELTMAGAAGAQVELSAGGRADADTKPERAPSTAPEPERKKPSSPGGPAETAPAPPRILTSKTGAEPAGDTGEGSEATGPGGQQQEPAGPTRGPGVVGGPAPVYPKDALDRGLEGRVTVKALIAADGSVSSVEIAESSGHPLLDQAAARAVRRGWTFDPALENGEPAAGSATVTFQFTSGQVERK
jgi:protein TonB